MEKKFRPINFLVIFNGKWPNTKDGKNGILDLIYDKTLNIKSMMVN